MTDKGVLSPYSMCVIPQVDLERMVTGTVLTPDTVSIHFIHYSPSLTGL